MYKLAFLSAVSAGFFGDKDPFENSFFKTGKFPNKGNEDSEEDPFESDFFKKGTFPKRSSSISTRRFVKKTTTPTPWKRFLNRRHNDENNVSYDEEDDSLSVDGTVSFEDGDNVTFDKKGFNGYGA